MTNTMTLSSDEDSPIEVGDGTIVVCMSSDDYDFYKPGELFIVKSFGKYCSLINFTPRKFDQDATFGGDWGTWAVYKPDEQSLEDLL